MAKAKMQARLRYRKQEDDREGYAIEILSDGEWGTYIWVPLVSSEFGLANDYVHWSILEKLSHLQHLGYEIDLMF